LERLTEMFHHHSSNPNRMVCPRIISTDVDELRLLAEWHEVSLRALAGPTADAVLAGV
jgi:hypothetical protein